MLKKLKFIIYTRAFMLFTYYLVTVYCRTLSLKIIDQKKWEKAYLEGKTILFSAWHQQFFAGILFVRSQASRKPGIMISQSNDGELIAGIAEKLGWCPARGSSTRGGKTAMSHMIKHLIKYRFGAHVLDGPTGPIGKVKPGIVKMAQEADAVVVPVFMESENAWFFNSWDRFMLPKPFSKVTIRFGDGVRLPTTSTRKEFEQQQLMIESIMKPGLFYA